MALRDSASVSEVLDRPAWLLAITVVTVVLLVAVRVLLGTSIGDAVQPITYYGVVGGLLGAVAMVVLMDLLEVQEYPPSVQFWARFLGSGKPDNYVGAGLFLHVVYGTVAGGLYPRLAWLAGAGGELYAGWPLGLVGGLIFGVVLFFVAVLYRIFGLFRMEMAPRQVWTLALLHLVYGVVLGFVTALHGIFG